jgi:hypothetical protein
MGRKWPKHTWIIVIFALLIGLSVPALTTLAGMKQDAVTAVQQLLNSSLGVWARVVNIWLLLINFIVLVGWLFCLFIAVSIASRFFEKHSAGYKRFLLWFLPVKNIGAGIVLYVVYLVYYLLMIVMNSVILLLAGAFLVIGIYSMVPSFVSLSRTAMELLYKFFALDYDASSFFADFSSIKASEVFGNQTITFFVILFAYLIKVMTHYGYYGPLLLKLSGHRFVRFYLRINNILSYNYLRIAIYVVAFLVFMIQASYKIMSDVNNIFATFIIMDVILYTIVSGFRGKAGSANGKLKDYFNEVYSYISEVQERMEKQISLRSHSPVVASISFIHHDFKSSFVEKLYLYTSKERRQRYLIARKIAILLKTKYAGWDEFLQASVAIKKHILNTRRYMPNEQYERMAVRLDEIKLEMENVLREYRTSPSVRKMLEKTYAEKQIAFQIQPKVWSFKDQVCRWYAKLRNKQRVALLDRQYEEYLDSIKQVNQQIAERNAENVVSFIQTKLNS